MTGPVIPRRSRAKSEVKFRPGVPVQRRSKRSHSCDKRKTVPSPAFLLCHPCRDASRDRAFGTSPRGSPFPPHSPATSPLHDFHRQTRASPGETRGTGPLGSLRALPPRQRPATAMENYFGRRRGRRPLPPGRGPSTWRQRTPGGGTPPLRAGPVRPAATPARPRPWGCAAAAPPHAGPAGRGRAAGRYPPQSPRTWQWETTRLWLPSPWYFHSFSSIFSTSMPGPGRRRRRAPWGRCPPRSRLHHRGCAPPRRRKSRPPGEGGARPPSAGRACAAPELAAAGVPHPAQLRSPSSRASSRGCRRGTSTARAAAAAQAWAPLAPYRSLPSVENAARRPPAAPCPAFSRRCGARSASSPCKDRLGPEPFRGPPGDRVPVPHGTTRAAAAPQVTEMSAR